MKTIIGYDASPGARDALRLGFLLAQAGDSDVVVTAIHPPGSDARCAEAQLGDAIRRLPYGSRPDLVPLEARSVPGGLHDLAESVAADLLVVGIGRSSGRYVHSSPCPVAIAPRGFRDEADPGLRVIGVAYDGSAESQQALNRAEWLALKAGATLRIIGVLEPASAFALAYGGFSGVGDPSFGRGALHHILESAAESVSPATRAQTVMATGSAVDEITRRAGVLDLLVIGSRGYGPVRRVLLGGVSAGIVRSAPCPVLVVPRSSRRLRQADAPALVTSR